MPPHLYTDTIHTICFVVWPSSRNIIRGKHIGPRLLSLTSLGKQKNRRHTCCVCVCVASLFLYRTKQTAAETVAKSKPIKSTADADLTLFSSFLVVWRSITHSAVVHSYTHRNIKYPLESVQDPPISSYFFPPSISYSPLSLIYFLLLATIVRSAHTAAGHSNGVKKLVDSSSWKSSIKFILNHRSTGGITGIRIIQHPVVLFLFLLWLPLLSLIRE